MESVDTKERLVELLRSFENVMVTTNADNGSLHARPMAIAEVDDDAELWFVSPKTTEKIDEVRTDRRVVVTGQADGRYVSVSGRMDVIHDRERVRALWKSSWEAWAPRGKDDPNVVLLRLRPEIGEYWEEGAAHGARHLFEAARALLDGEDRSPSLR